MMAIVGKLYEGSPCGCAMCIGLHDQQRLGLVWLCIAIAIPWLLAVVARGCPYSSASTPSGFFVMATDTM